MLKTKKMYFSTDEKLCQYRLNQEMYNMVKNVGKQYKRIAVVGIVRIVRQETVLDLWLAICFQSAKYMILMFTVRLSNPYMR